MATLARRNLGQRDRRPAVAVLAQETETFSAGAAPKFCTATSINQGTPAARMPSAGASEAMARLGRAAIDAIDQVQSPRPPRSACAVAVRSSVGSFPLPDAEIGDQVDDALLAVVLAQQLADGLQGGHRPGGGLRDFEPAQLARPACRRTRRRPAP